MAAQIIKPRRSIPKVEYSLEFGIVDNKRGCYSFLCDANGNIKSFACEEARINYEEVIKKSKIDDYWKPHIEKYKYTIRENATAICECGKEIELWDEYQGASECEYCGRWHNLWGQELISPEYWED